MKITKMTKEDFKKIPYREHGTNIGLFRSLVIIPTRRKHESGWMNMDFVAVDDNNEPICKFGGCSDVLHLDGIGGYGEFDFDGFSLPSMIKPKSWRIDCLPCGYLRLSSRYNLGTEELDLSDMDVYSKDGE